MSALPSQLFPLQVPSPIFFGKTCMDGDRPAGIPLVLPNALVFISTKFFFSKCVVQIAVSI